MTDKEKIRAEIEKKIKVLSPFTHQGSDTCGKVIKQLESLVSFINSLPEEPVSEDLEEAGREWLRPQLDKYYVCYGETKMMELTRFDGYAMLDAIEFGAQWQKEKIKRVVDKIDINNHDYEELEDLYDVLCEIVK